MAIMKLHLTLAFLVCQLPQPRGSVNHGLLPCLLEDLLAGLLVL